MNNLMTTSYWVCLCVYVIVVTVACIIFCIKSNNDHKKLIIDLDKDLDANLEYIRKSKRHDDLCNLMKTCPICGNKRCPKVESDEFDCSDSNELNQTVKLSSINNLWLTTLDNGVTVFNRPLTKTELELFNNNQLELWS